MTQKDFIEKSYINQIRFFNQLTDFLYYSSEEDKEKLKKLLRVPKNKEKAYGYYPTSWYVINKLHTLFKKHKVNSFVDLGAGMGHLIGTFQSLGYEAFGIENEPILIQLNHCNNLEYGDILKPLKLNKRIQAVYFYEPFIDKNLCKEFVLNLEKSLKKGTFIFYVRAGSIYTFLEESKHFTSSKGKGAFDNIFVYKKIK